MSAASAAGRAGDPSGDRAEAALRGYAHALRDAPLNLVSRRDRGRIAELHVAEGRLVAAAITVQPGGHVVDLGSGGGLPGAVIAIMRPDLRVTCLDATAKKMTWLAGVAERLDIPNLACVAGRAEVVARDPALRAQAHVVVSRAVASVVVVAELARGLLTDGGLLVVVKGPTVHSEVRAFNGVRTRLGYAAAASVPLTGAPRPTTLVQARAVGSPPAWVPRSDGTPQREPLS